MADNLKSIAEVAKAFIRADRPYLALFAFLGALAICGATIAVVAVASRYAVAEIAALRLSLPNAPHPAP